MVAESGGEGGTPAGLHYYGSGDQWAAGLRGETLLHLLRQLIVVMAANIEL